MTTRTTKSTKSHDTHSNEENETMSKQVETKTTNGHNTHSNKETETMSKQVETKTTNGHNTHSNKENETMSKQVETNGSIPAIVAATPAPTSVLSLPPLSAAMPKRPAGFTPVKGGLARGLKPKKSEAVALPGAIEELRAFSDYTGTLGKTVPAQSKAVQTLDAASQWTTHRISTNEWAEYAANEEGVAWISARAVVERMKPAYALALQADPSLATTYPKLTALLAAQRVIARKAVSSRTANNKQVAKGETPTHGASAKKKAKAAKEAAADTPPVSPSPPATNPTPAPPAAPAESPATNGTNRS